jgi:hypothetical protein
VHGYPERKDYFGGILEFREGTLEDMVICSNRDLK